MSRTPEETARLANEVGYPHFTFRVEGDSRVDGDCLILAQCIDSWPGWLSTRSARKLAHLLADLAEARAEVAALRDHLAALRADAALLAEWRKWREERRAAKVRAYSLESEILRGDALRAVWNRLAVARAAVRAIEARMLATATAEEVGRG